MLFCLERLTVANIWGVLNLNTLNGVGLWCMLSEAFYYDNNQLNVYIMESFNEIVL